MTCFSYIYIYLLGWSNTKLWPKAEGKDKRGMVMNEVKSIDEESRSQKAVQQPQQGQWANWDETYQRSLSHGTTSGIWRP